MSASVPAPREPFLTLPGFPPDALPFAARSVLALLLAYFIAFFAQVEAAASAGVCVAIVAQPFPGMATSKAIYRALGTAIGGCVALALMAAFPQDRTLLLTGFALWLGACAFVATLLRDFRSYGAALSGYTAGIIAIAAIDAPQSALIATLDRVAAILIGIASVLLVNSLLAGTGAFDALVRELRVRTEATVALAAAALRGEPAEDDLALLGRAAGAASLQTQAIFAALEMPDGRVRANGARHVIAALLAMTSALRTVAGTLGPDTAPAVRTHLRAVAAAMLRDSPGGVPAAPRPDRPEDALLVERADALLGAQGQARAGLRVLAEGGEPLPRIALRGSFDVPGALLGAVRTLIAVGLCSVFCVFAGWGGATLLLIQLAAVVALLGTVPNPSRASLQFGASLPVVALVVGAVSYLVLPAASGFLPFALLVAPMAFAAALASRQPVLGPYCGAALLYVALLLSPANPQTFNFQAFCNTVLQLALSVLFTTLSFNVILRVSPSRRLYRVARRVDADLGRTLRGRPRGEDGAEAHSLLFDRMSQALVWLGPPTPARRRLLGHIYRMGELDLALRRARAALAALARDPRRDEAASVVRRSLADGDPAAMLQAAETLLRSQDEPDGAGFRLAAACLAGVARLIGQDRAPFRFHRKLSGPAYVA